jgi:glycosyltransferase involved in cell wall biosynthesis
MAKKIRVMIVIHDLTGGGAELVVSNLCKNIDRSRFVIKICVLQALGYRGQHLKDQKFDIIGPIQQKLTNKYMTFLTLSKIVKRENIDIVHSHSTAALIEVGLMKCIMPSLPVMHTFHFGNYPFLPRRYLNAERLISKFFNVLISVGYNQREGLIKYLKINPHKIYTVHNGVDHNQEYPPHCALKKQTDGIVRIASISTFTEQKGLFYLLDAVYKLSQRCDKRFILYLIGDGPLRNKISLEVKKKKLEDQVILTGWVKEAHRSVLPHIDIFIQTSLWEAMSMAILEAMAAGKAIIATRVGDNEKVLQHLKTAILIDRANSRQITHALNMLIRDKSLQKSLGNNAIGQFKDHYTIQHMTAKYQAIYTWIYKKAKISQSSIEKVGSNMSHFAI